MGGADGFERFGLAQVANLDVAPDAGDALGHQGAVALLGFVLATYEIFQKKQDGAIKILLKPAA